MKEESTVKAFQTSSRPKLRRALNVLLLLLFICFAIFPVFWMVTTSIRPVSDVFRIPPLLWPPHPTLEPYYKVIKERPIETYFSNTLLVAVATVCLSAPIGALGAYGFSRFRFRGSALLLGFILATQMFPYIVIVLPYFQMLVALKLMDTYLGLIIAYTSFCLPFSTWMLKGFFDAIPRELDEAAMIDGCSRLRAFIRVVLPVSLPGLAATIVFAFLVAWNHYEFALILTQSPEKMLLSIAIPNLMGQFSCNWNELMAAGFMAILPPIIMYSFLGKYLVKGLTSGAMKE
ncbi:MAG: carbohydrate ABC transporter permease [Bacillota bacterium]